MGVSSTGASGLPTARFVSMDQFRGLTILLMFAVHYRWGVDVAPVLRHNLYYLSVGDLVFPWFHVAAGFALWLSLLRRLDRLGSWAAYRRTMRRCLLLILLGDLPPLLGNWQVSRFGPEQGTDLKAQIATYVRFDGWTILASIGVTSLWVLLVIGRSVRVRTGFLLGGLVLHAQAMRTFYLDFMTGRPNAVDTFLGTVGVRGREGGPSVFWFGQFRKSSAHWCTIWSSGRGPGEPAGSFGSPAVLWWQSVTVSPACRPSTRWREAYSRLPTFTPKRNNEDVSPTVSDSLLLKGAENEEL